MRSARMVALLAAGLVALSACSSPTDTPAGDGGDRLVVATAGEPDTLNPVLNYGVDGGSLIFDGLVARDDRNQLVPALARELPTVSADGRTVTAKLRDGVVFHDGSPLTAQDVVFTYQAVLDPKVDSTLRSDLDMLASVAAPDPSTVVFTLEYAYAPFLQRLALGIVPAKALAGQDVNKAAFNRKPVGTGPYRVTSWTPGDRLVLAANERYWGGKPANSGVVVAFVPDDNVRAQRMRAGEFDVAELAPKLASGFDGRSGYRVQRVPTADYRGVMLPMDGPVTGDPAVRKALNAAVDRSAMVAGVLGGAGSRRSGRSHRRRSSPSRRSPASRPPTRPPPPPRWTRPVGNRVRTASGSRTAARPRSPSCTRPPTASARNSPSRSPPTPGRSASRSLPRG